MTWEIIEKELEEFQVLLKDVENSLPASIKERNEKSQELYKTYQADLDKVIPFTQQVQELNKFFFVEYEERKEEASQICNSISKLDLLASGV